MVILITYKVFKDAGGCICIFTSFMEEIGKRQIPKGQSPCLDAISIDFKKVSKALDWDMDSEIKVQVSSLHRESKNSSKLMICGRNCDRMESADFMSPSKM